MLEWNCSRSKFNPVETRSSDSPVDDMRPQCGPVIRRLPAVALPSEPLRAMGPTVRRFTKLIQPKPQPSTIQVNFLPALSNQRTRHPRIFNIATRTYKRWTAGKQSLSSWLYTRGPSPPPCIPEEDELEVQRAEAEYKRTCEDTSVYEGFFSRLSNLYGNPTQMPQGCAQILHSIVDCATSIGAESHSIYWPDVDHTTCSTSNSSVTPRFLNRPASICVDGSLTGMEFIELSRTKNCATSLSGPFINEHLKDYCDFGWFGSGQNLFWGDQDARSVHTVNNHVCVSHCSPRSSAAGCDTKSLQFLPTVSGADPVGHQQPSTHTSSRSAEAVNRSTGSAEVPLESTCSTEFSSSPWQHHDLSQTTSGFVDAPRGNSVIVHHPTSPFARVLRAPTSTGKHNVDPVVRSPIESDSTVHAQRTAQHANTPDLFEPGDSRSSVSALPQPADRNHIDRSASKPANNMATTDPPKATDNTVKTTATNHRLQSHQSNDNHPTYEEAWDLKMTRQLGFGIPRLAPLSVTTPPSANRVTSGVTKSIGASAAVLSTRVTSATTSIVPSRLTSSGQASVETKILREQPALDSSKETVLSELSANPACIKGGLLFHENRLFDEGPIDCTTRTDIKSPESVQPNVEYDYAYNGCWSMGVRLNLSLAMGTAAPNSDLPSVNINPPGSRLDSTGAIPPAVPAHNTHRHLVNGTAGVTRTQLSRTALMPADYDGTSTDSRDDSWDRTHGQAISELTNARFVDPSIVLPVSSIAVAPSRPNGVKSSLTSSGPAGITATPGLSVLPPHQRFGGYVDPSRSDLAHQFPVGKAVGSQFAAVPFATSLPTPHWEVLPLEDQPHKTFLHMKISRNSNGQFILGEYSQPYTSVPQMIYRYACTKVPVQGAEFVTLVHPVCRRNN
ncbi:hypothetical protein AHF37_01863 [Paragonimus kellicotti]|nr:hypothetical protein AHF37_01863 [Paragonimus kellicotti]